MDCTNHPGMPAESYCQSCGKALCSRCITRDEGAVFCIECREKLADRGPSRWTADTKYSQQTERSRFFLTLGYIGAVAGVVLGFMLSVFNMYVFAYLEPTVEDYTVYVYVATWAISFPLSLLSASGYWGLRAKYDVPLLAVAALMTAAYMPLWWIPAFVPVLAFSSYEISFLYTTILPLGIGILVIVGLLLIKDRCSRPRLLSAVVAFGILGLVEEGASAFSMYFGHYSPAIPLAQWPISLFIGVIMGLPYVLFLRSERRAASAQ